jgi:hypothetical protein
VERYKSPFYSPFAKGGTSYIPHFNEELGFSIGPLSLTRVKRDKLKEKCFYT